MKIEFSLAITIFVHEEMVWTRNCFFGKNVFCLCPLSMHIPLSDVLCD
ncbi:hypothetical protein HMPREF0083_02210 [Aneurinibacillus aneurinilyticus ATCC 12856]|uniref:Uncharacterized protein n=1 Tax=Aneurinibacillus aneurinilyticus ATCC 12856 TaxID=649747 RepID=U1YFY2_ANEAE|nr:hypothetical protein HMPREF0083_02210 [Aneurinibacillus aneurinilyticus ATCC 12856]